jgi:chromosome segregation ATPase
MAKKHVQTIEIDVVTRGVEAAEKSIAGIDSSHGELYKHAQKVTKAIEKIRNITSMYGDNIPVAKAKELANYMKIISEETSDMADLNEVTIVNKKETENLKKISAEIESIQKRLKEIKKEKINVPIEIEKERLEELKTQKTAKGADGKSVSLSPLKNEDGSSKFETKADLEKLASSDDLKVAQAAQAALHQLGLSAEKASAKIAALNQEHDKLTNSLRQKNEQYNELSTTVRTLTDEEKTSFESVSKFTDELLRKILEATDATQKQGEEFVRTSKAIDGQGVSIGRAVKSLFS